MQPLMLTGQLLSLKFRLPVSRAQPPAGEFGVTLTLFALSNAKTTT